MVRDPGICAQKAIKDYFSGVHHKKSNCDSNAGLDKVKSIIESSKQHFFPERYIPRNIAKRHPDIDLLQFTICEDNSEEEDQGEEAERRLGGQEGPRPLSELHPARVTGQYSSVVEL